MKDPISRRSRGFGFITYEHSSYVDIALAQEVHTIDSRQVNLFFYYCCYHHLITITHFSFLHSLS